MIQQRKGITPTILFDNAFYASTAIEQNRWNKQVQCNYKGARWNNDAAGQNKWCLGVRPKVTNAETAARKTLLAKCYEDKLYMPNLFSIYGSYQSPSACRWNREGYQPVSHLLTRTNYNVKPEAKATVSRSIMQSRR